jgi:outer membrane protein
MKQLLTFCISVFSLGLMAQEENHFSLTQALDYALAHNAQMINASRDVQAAYAQKWATIAMGLPQVSAESSYQNQLKRPVSLLPGEFFGGEPGTYVPITFGQKQQMSISATLNQKIFDGSYIVGVQAIKTFIEISANAKQKTELEIRKAVVNAYGSVLLLDQSMAIINDNLSVLKQNILETQQLFQQGFAEEEQLEQLEITLLQLESQKRNTLQLQSITKQSFNLLLGRDLTAAFTLTEDLEALAAQHLMKQPKEDFLLENSVDYRIAFNQKEQKRLELKLEKSKYLPTLGAFVNYSTNAFGNTFEFFDSTQDWFDASILGLNLNIPVFSSFMKRSNTKIKKLQFEQSLTLLDQKAKQANLEFQQAKSQFELDVATYNSSKLNLSLAERIAKKNTIKYKEGVASSFELRQAQLQLYQAQQEYLKSMLDVINSKTLVETLN